MHNKKLVSIKSSTKFGTYSIGLLLEYSSTLSLTAPEAAVPSNPCQPSPCGPNSQCKVTNGQSVCSCLPEYMGSPPNCRPECVVSTECALDKTCTNHKCVSPCPGPCGLNTDCKVINHSPICTCRNSFTGDPFSRCYVMQGIFLFLISNILWNYEVVLTFLLLFSANLASYCN